MTDATTADRTTGRDHAARSAAMLRHWAAAQPDAPMLTLGDTTVTWGEVYDRASRVAAALAADGVGPGRPGGLPRPQRHRVLRGLLRLRPARRGQRGRQLAPGPRRDGRHHRGRRRPGPLLRPRLRGRRAGDRPRSSTASAPAVPARPSSPQWRDAEAGRPAADPGFEPGPDDVVTQLYTSGTTGLPKGVMISGRNIATHPDGGADEVFRIDADTVSMVAMPLFHIGGTGLGAVRHVAGRALGHRAGHRPGRGPAADRGAPDHRDLRGARRAHVPAGHPAAGRHRCRARCAPSSTGPPPSARTCWCGRMEALGCDFAQVYGLTETTGAITSLMPEDHDPDGPRAAPPALGRPALRPRGAAHRRHRHGRDAARRARWARSWTRSDQNMLGYWNKPEETAAVARRRRLVPHRRRRLARRGRLPVPPRPDQGHDRVRAARTSIRPRSRTPCSPTRAWPMPPSSACPTTGGARRSRPSW